MPQMVYSEHKWCFKSRQPARLMAWLEVRPAPRNDLWQQCPMHGAGAAEQGQPNVAYLHIKMDRMGQEQTGDRSCIAYNSSTALFS